MFLHAFICLPEHHVFAKKCCTISYKDITIRKNTVIVAGQYIEYHTQNTSTLKNMGKNAMIVVIMISNTTLNIFYWGSSRGMKYCLCVWEKLTIVPNWYHQVSTTYFEVHLFRHIALYFLSQEHFSYKFTYRTLKLERVATLSLLGEYIKW